MKLFYFQPDGHGSYSQYVCAETKQAAFEAMVQAKEQNLKDTPSDEYHYSDGPFTVDDLEKAAPGVVILNNND